MIENTKCECGHQNHVGTALCEACGKSLDSNAGTGLLDMRYEGAARRSQLSSANFIGRLWGFFSSVKVAIYLIVFTFAGAIVGTIFEQENVIPSDQPHLYYKNKYGIFGEIYYNLGLSDTFGSWWFKLLIVLLAASLIICSLDRVVPLYRALRNQKPAKNRQFLLRQRIVYQDQTIADTDQWLDDTIRQLKARRYRITREGNALLAEKNRFSRWGPYINHIGLIVLLLAVLTRGIPGWFMDEGIWLLEGEIKQIPGTNYYLKNEKFVEVSPADPGVAGGGEQIVHETSAVLYSCTANCNTPLAEPILEPVTQYAISPNKPLRYEDMLMYQIDFRKFLQLTEMDVTLSTGANGHMQPAGKFNIQLKNPKSTYRVGSITIALTEYFPDFVLESGKPVTKSRTPNNPAFFFEVSNEHGSPVEKYAYFPLMGVMQPLQEGDETYSFSILSSDDVRFSEYSSFIMIRVEKALPFILFGAIVFLIGVAMGLYWQHRRIWIRIEDGKVILAAHTNKNWYGLRMEIVKVLAKTGTKVQPNLLNNEVNLL